MAATSRSGIIIARTASCGSWSEATNTETDVINLAATVTVNGSPVKIGLVPDENNVSYLGVYITAALCTGIIYIYRDAVWVHGGYLETAAAGVGSVNCYRPPGEVWCVDTPPAGTYLYKVRGKGVAGTLALSNIKLLIQYA